MEEVMEEQDVEGGNECEGRENMDRGDVCLSG